MTFAIRAARRGIRKSQTPFGACIVRGGKVVVATHNHVWKNTDITAHAAVHALRLACRRLKTIDLSGCVIYSTCEPCPMCFSACHWARISKIVYGTSIADAARAGFNELAIADTVMKRLANSRVRLVPGFMREENLELFKEWRNRKDRKAY